MLVNIYLLSGNKSDSWVKLSKNILICVNVGDLINDLRKFIYLRISNTLAPAILLYFDDLIIADNINYFAYFCNFNSY